MTMNVPRLPRQVIIPRVYRLYECFFWCSPELLAVFRIQYHDVSKQMLSSISSTGHAPADSLARMTAPPRLVPSHTA